MLKIEVVEEVRSRLGRGEPVQRVAQAMASTGRRSGRGAPGGATSPASPACALGLRTMLTTAAGLITTLGKALYENRLEERLKILTQPKSLIIDEIGYIPIDRQGANLFFQLVSRR